MATLMMLYVILIPVVNTIAIIGIGVCMVYALIKFLRKK